MFHFGTGGWRDIIGDGFTRANINLLAQSVAELMKKEQADRIVIGFDRRFLSGQGAKWASEVFAGNGIHVLFIPKNVPTPLVMFAVREFKTKYGMAVTASHNPAEYNGIKVFTEGGRDAAEEVTNRIEEVGKTNPKIKRIDFDEAVEQGLVEISDPSNQYIDSILSMIDIPVIRNRGLKILLDPMFGVSKTCLQTILLTARCEVDIINDRHDTLFGGRLPSPSAQTLSRLSNMVVEQGYDIGIGTDGDADRIGIIDKRGNFIHPNQILMLLYYYLVRIKGWRGDVVRNIATTHLLDRMAKDFGTTCHEVPVGFKHISAKMEEYDALVGGESSGGLTIRGSIKGKDGILAASLLVEMICATGKDLSELLDEIYEKYGFAYMTEKSIQLTGELKQALQHLLFEEKKVPQFADAVEKISYLDGLKVYFQNGGWIIVRFSGTEPVVRIFCEMESRKKAEQIEGEMIDFLGISGYNEPVI